ncbi:MAG: DNA double-strand break repair nuclease NurA [Conexivisphaerales archaeon]
MIIETLEYAVRNKDSIVNAVNAEMQEGLMKRAGEMWISYTPREVSSKLAGIDSSWNSISYHGFYLYAVDAISVLPDGSYSTDPKFEVGIDNMAITEGKEAVHNPHLWLESKGMKYEHDLTVESSSFHVLIDGSVLARFYDSMSKKVSAFIDYASDLMKMSNVTFIAKFSTSNAIFNGAVGDMYYFTKVNFSAGFSMPVFDKGITVTYVRLTDYTPVLRVEIPYRADERDVRGIMDIIGSGTYGGYPYVLRIAHERCKISNSDMEIIEGALGLTAEKGSREVLGE